jgi:hypothetical protein
MSEHRAADTTTPAFGPCCCCETEGPTVRNVLSLHQRSPIAGRGWGCFVCRLPADGAVAVVCDTCLEAMASGNAVLVTACRGYPGADGRVPIAELEGISDHDENAHLAAAPRRALLAPLAAYLAGQAGEGA